MRKSASKLIGAIAVVLATSSAAQAKCGEVTITEMNWASSAIVTAVSKFLMEQGYGCKVVKVPSATVPAVASIAETNKPDIATELWDNSSPLYPKLVKQGKVKTLTNVLSDGGIEGWWIPKYLADKHPELTTIDGVLANPKLVGGRFHNCPVGWGCRIANDNLKVAFDLAGHGLEVFDHGSGETLSTSIAAAYADKKPWFGYYWAPTSVLGTYDMVNVDLGPHDADIHKCNQDQECTKPGKSSFPAANVVTAVTSDFAKREPEVVALMSKVAFTNATMGKLLAWQEENKASPDEAAVHFLTTYKDTWAEWLNDSAKQKLTKILK